MIYTDADAANPDYDDPECCHCDSMSVRSASPAPSLYSFSSSRDGHMLRDVHGRILNALCETYMLPADEPEFKRQNREHEVWKLQSQGGLCFSQELLDEVLMLAEDPSAPTKTVLDLGSGSGAWLNDMAIRYPWVEFTGIDLAPQKDGSTCESLPVNVTLEIDDINLGLNHWKSQFNVVHVRAISMGIKDYKKLLNEIGGILRPGGLLLLSEPDLELFHDNGDVLEAAFEDKPDGSWAARCLFEAYQASKRSGSSVEAGLMQERWLHDIPEFEDIHIEKVYNPVGPWMSGSDDEETRRLRQIGELTALNTHDFLQSLRPMLLLDGFFIKTIELMFGRARFEISEANLRRNGWRLFSKWHCASARRR